ENIRFAGAQHAGAADEFGVHVLGAGVGVQGDVGERADAAQDVLGRFADAEEQNDQRDPGNRGNGAQQFKDGLEDGFRPAGSTHGNAQHDADDGGDREADQHAAQADQQVADDDLAADGRVEGGEQQLQHLD